MFLWSYILFDYPNISDYSIVTECIFNYRLHFCAFTTSVALPKPVTVIPVTSIGGAQTLTHTPPV